MLFCVVEFDKSNCIDVVRSNWLVLFDDDVTQTTATHWPPFKHQLKISRAVRNRESPSIDWNLSAKSVHQVIISIAVST